MKGRSSWQSVHLGRLAKVISGYAFKSKQFQDNGIPVIKIKNIRVGTTDLSDASYVEPQLLSLDEKYHRIAGSTKCSFGIRS